MKYPKDYYEKIKKDILDFDEDIKERKEKILELGNEYNRKCTEIDEKTQIIFDETNANIKKVNAFLAIARAHTSQRPSTKSAKEFNNGILSRLAVQIDNNLSEDHYAKELYDEASAQFLGLQLSLNTILTKSKVFLIIWLQNRQKVDKITQKKSFAEAKLRLLTKSISDTR